MLRDVGALVAASLVRPIRAAGDVPRFTMLETIREYALEQLRVSGEEDATREAHANWCLALAETAMPCLSSPAQTKWLDRFEVEHDNMRAALGWLAMPPRTPLGARLVGPVWFFWFVHGHRTEGRSWLGRALEWSAGDRSLHRVRVLNGEACQALCCGDPTRSLALGEESLALGREIGHIEEITIADSPLIGWGPRRALSVTTIGQWRTTRPRSLGGEAFAGAWSAGRVLSLEAAVDEALRADIVPVSSTPAPAIEPWRRLGLTRREHDVLRLLAKLGIESRTAAVAIAVRDGLM